MRTTARWPRRPWARLGGRRLTLIGLLLALGLGLIYLALAADLPIGTLDQPGHGFFPVLVGVLFVVFGAISLVGEILGASRHGYPTGSETDEDGRWTTLWRVAAVLAALVTYTALAPSVGHVVMASVSGLIILRVLGGRPWWQTITLAILLGVGSGLLFANLLGLPLPGPGLFVW